MTTEEAKEYAITHLPCTMTGVVALFDLYFKGVVVIDKLVGMNVKLMGYNRLVFCLTFPLDAIQECHPQPKLTRLVDCFKAWCAFHNFTIEKETIDRHTLQPIYWVVPPIEIKEDRERR